MQYKEFPAAEPLANYVKCFWVLEGGLAASEAAERILPDGCIEIIFNLGAPFKQHNADGSTQRQPLNLLVGQMRRHLLIEPTGIVRLLGVRFWPGGAHPFLMFPQAEITDRIIDLEAVLGGAVRDIESRFSDTPTPVEALRHVQTVLLARLRQLRRHDESLSKAVALILCSGGRVSIKTLAEEMGISSRNLDRRFHARVGLSPKALCRIVRFQRVFRMLERNPADPNWVKIALDCGYYDQSHFIREFKSLSGKEPTSYFSQPNIISDHFTSNP
jgi:AraC-like DNA-binding protein